MPLGQLWSEEMVLFPLKFTECNFDENGISKDCKPIIWQGIIVMTNRTCHVVSDISSASIVVLQFDICM
jgi:hypothetical protein